MRFKVCVYKLDRIYSAPGTGWLFIDQKDPDSPSGWRVAGICAGHIELFFWGVQWDPVVLDGVADPNAHIATHFQDAGGRVWIAFAPDADHPQGALASYHSWYKKWTQHQLPADFPAIVDDATLLRVGNDLWVENPETTKFTILEDVVTEE